MYLTLLSISLYYLNFMLVVSFSFYLGCALILVRLVFTLIERVLYCMEMFY